MKTLLLSCSLFLFASANAQKMYTVSKDSLTGQTIFKGRISLEDLKSESSFRWYAKAEKSYNPDSTAVGYLSTELPDFTIIAFMGTWCDDSQDLIPKLAKVLTRAGFPEDKLVLYGVDRAKKTNGIESEMFQISRVPTIILFKANHEAGRVVESVNKNLESDLARIIDLYNQRN
jgi:thiol-disulfide isomerase/thioredoxin